MKGHIEDVLQHRYDDGFIPVTIEDDSHRNRTVIEWDHERIFAERATFETFVCSGAECEQIVSGTVLEVREDHEIADHDGDDYALCPDCKDFLTPSLDSAIAGVGDDA